MISTKNLLLSVSDIPDVWILSHILNLSHQLSGEEIKILSPLTDERTPSFSLFVGKEGKYLCKDFSSGFFGGALALAYELKKKQFPHISKANVYAQLMAAYKDYLKSGNAQEPSVYEKVSNYHVDGYEMRGWNHVDKEYWGRFHITSKTLEYFNVAALNFFTMSKTIKGIAKQIKITRPRIYSYFDKTGTPYKIYQPENEVKFIKIQERIAGDDQRREGIDNLLITKSLKDVACFHELGLREWDAISPSSENTLLPAKYVADLKKRYKKIVVLFDNDRCGYDSREKYKQKYEIPYLDFNMGVKDLSDSSEAHGLEAVKTEFIKLL